MSKKASQIDRFEAFKLIKIEKSYNNKRQRTKKSYYNKKRSVTKRKNKVFLKRLVFEKLEDEYDLHKIEKYEGKNGTFKTRPASELWVELDL